METLVLKTRLQESFHSALWLLFKHLVTFPKNCQHLMIDALLEIQLNLSVHIIQLFYACGFY